MFLVALKVFSLSWIFSTLTIMGLHVALFIFTFLWIWWVFDSVILYGSPYLINFQPLFLQTFFFTLASGTKQPMSDILILSHKSLKRSVHVFFFLFSSYWMVAIDSSLGRLLPSSLCAKINQWILYFIYFIF